MIKEEGKVALQERGRALASIAGLVVRQGVPLADLTYFRSGGPADLLVLPRTKESLIELKRLCRREGWPLTVFGRATNVLVSDRGIRGITALLSPALAGIRRSGDSLICAAGVPLYEIAAFAAREALAGFEFACGIPGSIGGAIFMNAGAFDGSMADVVVKTSYVDGEGTGREIEGEEHDFSYRHSYFSDKAGAIILETELGLKRGSPTAIYQRMGDYARRRYQTQPLAAHSAGSAFRRPPGHFAGKLITDAGMKGYISGRAGVSAKHAGFIVNLGGASSEEILQVFLDVRQAVFKGTGLVLVPEVRLVGDWDGDPFA